jgi:hypothetical protein
MMNHRALQIATCILASIAPKDEREPIVGDLMEEYSLRARAMSSSEAVGWCLRQACASAPTLLWARLTRVTWIPTISVALLGYVAVGVVEFMANGAISSLLPSGSGAYRPLELIITFPAVVLIAYFASRLRRGAAIVLGAMMLLAVTVMTLTAAESVPLWYQIAYFVAGPAATFIGSTLRSLRCPTVPNPS